MTQQSAGFVFGILLERTSHDPRRAARSPVSCFEGLLVVESREGDHGRRLALLFQKSQWAYCKWLKDGRGELELGLSLLWVLGY